MNTLDIDYTQLPVHHWSLREAGIDLRMWRTRDGRYTVHNRPVFDTYAEALRDLAAVLVGRCDFEGEGWRHRRLLRIEAQQMRLAADRLERSA